MSSAADTMIPVISPQSVELIGQYPDVAISYPAAPPRSATRRHLRHVPRARRALAEIAHEPPARRRLGLR